MFNCRFLLILAFITLLGTIPLVTVGKNNSQKLLFIPDKAYNNTINKILPRKYKNGLFWKIEFSGYKPSYLLGTIHFNDPRALAIIAKVKTQFDASHILCTEIELGKSALQEAKKASLYPKGTYLKSVIPPALYKQVLILGRRYGFSEKKINQYRPWALAMIFQKQPKQKPGGVDSELYKSALKKNKKTCGLEKIHEQIDVFQTMALRRQIEMLTGVLLTNSLLQYQTNKMIKIYQDRDLNAMAKMMKTPKFIDIFASKDDLKFKNDFIYKLIIRRNMIMVNRMQPYLRKGNTFFAVGALHLPGKKGMLQLLESLGYKITLIY